MNLEEYQHEVRRTMNDGHGKYSLANYALGLAGEYLEACCANDRLSILKELGDVAWYCAAIANECLIKLDDQHMANSSMLSVFLAVEAVKKHVFHGHQLDTNELAKNLSCIIGWVRDMAAFYESSLSEVLEANKTKLRKRYPEGFSETASVNRKENQ